MSTITSTDNTSAERSTAPPLAYRCSRCFQTRCSTVDRAGQAEECDLCGHKNTVPEATADRISQGESFLQKAAAGAVSQFSLTNEPPPMSTAEIMKQCRQKTTAKHVVSGRVASKGKRFFGSLIDGLAMCFALMLGLFVAMLVSYVVGAPVDGEEPDILYSIVVLTALFSLPVVLLITQWVMAAKYGRSVGKYCVKTKIINKRGKPPGFLRGVVMRYWVNGLLGGLLPFYGLIDAIWIFTGSSNRCVHDLLAGTSVIDAT